MATGPEVIWTPLFCRRKGKFFRLKHDQKGWASAGIEKKKVKEKNFFTG